MVNELKPIGIGIGAHPDLLLNEALSGGFSDDQNDRIQHHSFNQRHQQAYVELVALLLADWRLSLMVD